MADSVHGYSIFDQADAGDRSAQRGLLELIELNILAGSVSPDEGLSMAEDVARQLLPDGHVGDKIKLVSILSRRVDIATAAGDIMLADILNGHGLALLAEMADDGLVEAEPWLNNAMGAASPAACMVANEIARRGGYWASTMADQADVHLSIAPVDR